MLRIFRATALFVSCLLCSCATSGQTTIAGLGIGTLVGGTIGVLVDSGPKGRLRGQNLFCGTTVGAIAGATGAYLLHSDKPKLAEMNAVANQTNALMNPLRVPIPNMDHPAVDPPEVETRYVDDSVKGNTFIPGHLEFRIVKPGQWSKE